MKIQPALLALCAAAALAGADRIDAEPAATTPLFDAIPTPQWILSPTAVPPFRPGDGSTLFRPSPTSFEYGFHADKNLRAPRMRPTEDGGHVVEFFDTFGDPLQVHRLSAPQLGGQTTADRLDYEVSRGGGFGGNFDEDARFRMSFFFGDVGNASTRILATSSERDVPGQTFRANAQNNPNWDSIIATLTNGINDGYFDSFSIDSTVVGSTNGPESSVLGGAPSTNGIDLEGFEIVEVLFTVISLSIQTNQMDGGNFFTDYSIRGTLSFRFPDIFADGFESGDVSAWDALIQE
ncbi:MAG: hypothetical protein AAGM22_10375 [Acidobacteriota bacterium]